MFACLRCSQASSAKRPGRDLDWLTAVPFAHRGLHGPDTGPENSLPAFAAACDAGYGIECDVRLLADGGVVVFHDRGLNRLTGQAGPLDQLTCADLPRLCLLGSGEHPPLLAEVLSLVAGRVPLYIELKSQGRAGRLEQAVAALLAGYSGPVVVASFHPWSLARLAFLAPELPRCLIACDFADAPAMGRLKRFAYANLFHAAIARPHCIAYGWRGLPHGPVALVRWLGWPVLLWTVRSREDRVKALRHGDNIVFEGFLPTSPGAIEERADQGDGPARE
ncbi:glycerophosphodiester phosphodiesterase family protein [Desulfovibrio sp. TomC]|uniref:glycerophosphodiester phosphodiesterase family protein n=1 Tax=Desulfovibrio sp. TomC TaxID=1562888 RepID=UPI0005748108|nr:glycerophosphodiester phosphodiesterase family protein [Desulfovibrio sp. TomC]KHK04418.1 Glycerophosphoryl diester phosphodiesterase [Desulfovibrio sp. TomC]